MTTPPTSLTIALTDRQLGDLELLLSGAFAPLRTYPGPLDLAAIRAGRALADGTAWPEPVSLDVPAATRAGDRLELVDPEGAPVADLAVTEAWQEQDRTLVTGDITPRRPVAYGPFRQLRRTPEQVRAELGDRPALAHIAAEPLLAAELAALRAESERQQARILILVAIGETDATFAAPSLVHAVLAARSELPADTLIVPIPLSTVDDGTLGAHVAANYGATNYAGTPDLVAGPLPVSPIPKVDRAALIDLLDSGTEIPQTMVSEPVAAVLRRARPPRDRRGVVVFFTGFSGSGKSTVARGLYDHILESGQRPVTLLDGDVVRRLLSAGLGFSRTDRDLNINRIGFVAAEIARAGGIAICAPIAPYAATRAEVRRRVTATGDFLLIHVATPLEVCEARDRKGLYAKARAGIIPEFTGVSDPYEVPDDAELRLDTSTMSEAESVDTVMKLLTERGYLKE